MRSILGLPIFYAALLLTGLLLTALAPVCLAGDTKADDAGITPEQVARIILEQDGPQQALVAQFLREANHETLLAVQRAIRKLAPEVAADKKARGPAPSADVLTDAPVDVVTIEVRFLEMDKDSDVLAGARLHGQGKAPAGKTDAAGATVQWLDDTQVEVILRAVEKSEHIRQITAPRLTVYDRQHANVSILNQLSYVEAYRVESGGRLCPVRATAQEGMVVGLRPTISKGTIPKDKRFITLEIEGTRAELAKPVEQRTVEVGGRTVTTQHPRSTIRHWRSTVRVPDGGAILMQHVAGDRVTDAGDAAKSVKGLILVTARADTLSPDVQKALRVEIEKEAKKARARAEQPQGKPGDERKDR